MIRCSALPKCPRILDLVLASAGFVHRGWATHPGKRPCTVTGTTGEGAALNQHRAKGFKIALGAFPGFLWFFVFSFLEL